MYNHESKITLFYSNPKYNTQFCLSMNNVVDTEYHLNSVMTYKRLDGCETIESE